MVYDLGERLADWLVADDCLLCGAPGRSGICAGCRAELPWNTAACSRCAQPMPSTVGRDMRCPHCERHAPAFDLAIVPLRFEGVVAALVRQFKYRRRLAAGRLLGALLADAVRDAADGGQALPGVLLPTPLHAHRLRERGFNQAAELTRQLSARLKIPWRTGQLRRIHDTPSLTTLSRDTRRRSLRHAFAWHGDVDVPTVAVVDDVVTSAATAEAMATALKHAGCERVEIWAPARTPFPSALREGRDSPSTGPI